MFCVCGVIFICYIKSKLLYFICIPHTLFLSVRTRKVIQNKLWMLLCKAMSECLRKVSIGLKLWRLCYILHSISGMIDSQRKREQTLCVSVCEREIERVRMAIWVLLAAQFFTRQWARFYWPCNCRQFHCEDILFLHTVTQTTASLPLTAVTLATAFTACMKRILGNL